MRREPHSSQELIDNHRSNGLLIDTNLILLFVVGSISRNFIGKFKRTQNYLQEDFQKVAAIRLQFSKHWVTPNILTETDSLGRQLPQNCWPHFSKAMANLTHLITEQKIVRSTVIDSGPQYTKLGLTDSVSLMLGRPLLILTDDFRMQGTAVSLGIDVINLNHLRYSWK